MTTNRLVILLAVVLAGMSSIFLLPKQLGFQPTGIELQLPKMVGGWYGTDIAVSDNEISTLGKGTEFARKSYRNGRGYEITASIVLSGQDMNTSIHRPERCVRAQGFTTIDERAVALPLANRKPLRVTRLQNMRSASGPDDKPVVVAAAMYYWFVGHTDSTASHFTRTWLDVKDRLIHGYNQRWAFFSVSGQVPEDPAQQRVYDEMIEDFIKQLLPKIQKETVQNAE